MINTLSGLVVAIDEASITLETNQIGFVLGVTNPQNYEIGKQVILYTYLHWNQEHGPSLFGFATEQEKKIFLLIISCSGIGPKIGLALVAQMSPSAFIAAINQGNQTALSAVNGIGAKKAEQIIVQLKHKIAKLVLSREFEQVSTQPQRYQITEVLKSLNYSKNEIGAAMNYLNEHCPDISLPFDQLMRTALSFLAKK